MLTGGIERRDIFLGAANVAEQCREVLCLRPGEGRWSHVSKLSKLRVSDHLCQRRREVIFRKSERESHASISSRTCRTVNELGV